MCQKPFRTSTPLDLSSLTSLLWNTPKLHWESLTLCSLKPVPNLLHLFLISFQHKLEELMEVIWSYFTHNTKITSTHMHKVIHCCTVWINKTLKAMQMVKAHCYINFDIFSSNMLWSINKKNEKANIETAPQDIMNLKKSPKYRNVYVLLLFV